MKSKILELLVFLSLYPRGLIMLIVGSSFAAWLATISHEAMVEFTASVSSKALVTAASPMIFGIYRLMVLIVLVSSISAAITQFSKDKKRFDMRF